MDATIKNIDNKGSIISEQNVDNKGGNFAQRDIHQNYYEYHETNPSFAEIEFENESKYPHPTFTEELILKIQKCRILIIKGNNHFDQFLFGRQIANILLSIHPHFKAIELIQNEEDKALDDQLKKIDKEHVVVLNEIHPRHIRYDLKTIIQVAENQQSFYIINTNSSEETWMKSIGDLMQVYWYEIPESDHYFKTDLLPWFMEKVKEKKIPFLVEIEEINEHTKLVETKDINGIVDVIDTPQSLLMFLNMIGDLEAPLLAVKLEKIINNLQQSQEQVVIKWFNNLTDDQRMIALTVALFNGLFVNQYFQILTELIEKSFWRQSSKTLDALDYHNLDFLTVLFRFESTEEGDLIVSKHKNTRVHLLKTAISQFPRHIEKALIVFSDIMQESYKRNPENWELYGTTQKRALLRQVFIEATRDIGMNNLSNIESIYLKLAASDHTFVQKIVAKSLAQYRLFEEDDLLFTTLLKWLKSKTIKQRIDLFLTNDKGRSQNVIKAIKTTTISTLAYAADYDQPNQLRPEIVDYLITFAKDHDREIQGAVANVLPKFILHHSYQLRNEIFDALMPNERYRNQISEGVMKAYRIYAKRMKSVMEHWLSICMKEESRSQKNRRVQTTFRDNALISILNTLSKIEILVGGFSVKELYNISIELLKTENRTDVIRANLSLLSYLHSIDYQMAFNQIPETFSTFSKVNRDYMVQSWTEQFLEQRRNLPNREFTIVIDELEYPAWLKLSDRPLTVMEETLFNWLNSRSTVARKFATLTFLEIAKSFEKEEYKEMKRYEIEEQERSIRDLQNEQQRLKRAERMKVNLSVQKQVGLGLWLKIKIFFYLLMEDKLTKQNLKEIILTFISEPYSKQDLKYVLYKWRIREKGVFSSKMAKWLSKLMKNM